MELDMKDVVDLRAMVKEEVAKALEAWFTVQMELSEEFVEQLGKRIEQNRHWAWAITQAQMAKAAPQQTPYAPNVANQALLNQALSNQAQGIGLANKVFGKRGQK